MAFNDDPKMLIPVAVMMMKGKYDNSLMVAWRIGSTWRAVPGLVRVARIKIPSEARNNHCMCNTDAAMQANNFTINLQSTDIFDSPTIT